MRGLVPVAGRRWSVAAWLEHWLENIARPDVRQRAATRLIGRRSGGILFRVSANIVWTGCEPEHLERLYRRDRRGRVRRPGTAHQVHRTARTAFGEAVRRGHVAQNPAALAKPPRVEPEEVEPYPSMRCSASLLRPKSRTTGSVGRSRLPWACVRVRCWVFAGPMLTW